jgi:hypothetical protein
MNRRGKQGEVNAVQHTLCIMVLGSVILSLELVLEIIKKLRKPSYGGSLVGTVALSLPMGHNETEQKPSANGKAHAKPGSKSGG